MDEKDVPALRDEARRLVALLEDPHPGLFTWVQAVVRSLKAPAAYVEE